ncbi:Aerobic glycerol-3-phosphate dehydrogenase [Poriferisphaera corsica]|uniref:Glycerol-3-phosphate dehydrogenase n=1 Tax=Poriferisphaera corsica TaxID=2528020 RepID=A0A517YW04_9BACT|nr:glycerol-3-phosphate dehydrogenase/oxidase [Poriferisphaera corsica]QDU34400.1 Aerobic glycerol-3-phosphate dehydrogenase [Poriferisphaera corsica]
MRENIEVKRKEAIKAASHDVKDLLVIGGGIVGAGVARDAAMRGLDVVVVDKHDVSFGTSSRSSRLLHGGIRYLQQMRVGLVREASLEKCVIGDIAPHLAQGLRFIYPVYKHHPQKMWQMKIGVKIYDLLCSGRNFGKSESANVKGTQKWLPKINTDQLSGSVRYFDGLTSDSRLVIDSLRSAEAYGAKVINYMQVVNAKRANGLWECKLMDHMTGQSTTVKAKTVVNATGPWSEQFKQSQLHLRPSKGVHIVVDREKLPVDDAVVITEGKRILFVIPWGERLILGTTDTDYQDDIEKVKTDQEDIDYIVAAANSAFDNLGLSRDDVISHWVGLRPLIADPNGTPSDISRKHQILQTKEGWIDIGGGKLTTYRLMAEETVDLVLKYTTKKTERCRTAQEKLLAKGLEDKYTGIVPCAVTREAVNYYCDAEWARTLADVMVRRSSWVHYFADNDAIAEKVSVWMAEILGWNEAERQIQLEAYQETKEVTGSNKPINDDQKSDQAA